MDKNQDYRQCYQRALSLLSRRAYFSKKLVDKLKSLLFSADIINQVIEDLTEKKYLNDREYALQKISSWKSKGLGLHQIKNKLQNLNIKMSDVISQENNEHEFNQSNITSNQSKEQDLEQVLNYLLYQKNIFLERIKSHPQTYKEKLYRHLIYKGHDLELIKKVWMELKHNENGM
jgi:SOS response regulatory protein OraA/RecX